MNSFAEWKLVAVMLAVTFALSIVNLLLKKVLNEGMNQLIIVTYRQSISAIFLAPIAYFWERYVRICSFLTFIYQITSIFFPSLCSSFNVDQDALLGNGKL